MTGVRLTTRATHIWAVALTGAALFMITLDNLIVVSTMPSMQVDLGVSIDRLQWVVDAYILVFAVFILTGAALGDRYGRRRMLVVGLLVFSAASAAGALSNDLTQLVVARAVQGLGAALLMPLTLTLLSAAFPPERRTAALGLWSSIAGLGVALGPLLGGLIVESLDWHWIFWINVPVGVTAAVLAPRRLTESRGAQVPLDLPGLALASGGLFGIVWATTRGNEIGWTSPSTLFAYAAGAALLGLFVLQERRSAAADAAARALPPARLLGCQRRRLRAALHDVRGLLHRHPVPHAGARRHRPFARASRRCRGRSCRSSSRPSRARSAAASAAGRSSSPACSCSPRGRSPRPSRWASARATPSSIAPLVAIGFGIALVLPNVASAALGSALPEHIGKASGANSTFRQLGGVFGIAVAVLVFDRAGSYASAADVVDGARAALFVASGVGVLGAVAALGIPRKVRAAAPRTRGRHTPCRASAELERRERHAPGTAGVEAARTPRRDEARHHQPQAAVGDHAVGRTGDDDEPPVRERRAPAAQVAGGS